MKSRVIQLCINVGTWNMTAILGLGYIQVRGGLLGFRLEYVMEVGENFRDQE